MCLLFHCLLLLCLGLRRSKYHLIHPLHEERLQGQAYPHEEFRIHVGQFQQVFKKHDVAARMPGKPGHIMALFLQQIAQEVACMEFRETVEVVIVVHYILLICLFNKGLKRHRPLQCLTEAACVNSWCKNRLSHYFTTSYSATEMVQMCNNYDTIYFQQGHRRKRFNKTIAVGIAIFFADSDHDRKEP